jgi:hypothetical protein
VTEDRANSTFEQTQQAIQQQQTIDAIDRQSALDRWATYQNSHQKYIAEPSGNSTIIRPWR